MIPKKNLVLTSNGQFDGSDLADMQAYFADVSAADADRPIVVHFHGGLVNDQSGRQIAENLFSHYSDEGALPLFFIWRAGLFEVIGNNLKEIAAEDLFPVLVERVAQYLTGMLKGEEGERGEQVELPGRNEIRKNLRRTDGKEPFVENFPEPELKDDTLSEVQKTQFEDLLEKDPRLPEALQEAAEHDLDTFNSDLKKDLEAIRNQPEEGERAIFSTAAAVAAGLRIVGRCVNRFAKRRAHGFYPTIVEEVVRELKGDWLANIVWKRMKGDTADAFNGIAETHGGTALLSELKKLHPADNNRRIILVGHSTGALYISELLRAAEQTLPEDIRFDVVFLAPACTFDHLAETLGTAGGRITGFRSFAMKDPLEQSDKLVPVLYPRSLLYFVSGLCEPKVDAPIVGMQRYFTDAFPFLLNAPENKAIKTVVTRFGNSAHSWVWSISNATDGQKTGSEKHGDFDNDDHTLESVSHIIGNGF